jgi:uncharacterized membrane protein YedE/YeeE
MSQPLSGGDITNTITAVLIFDAAATILQLYYVMGLPLDFEIWPNIQLSPLFFAMLGDIDLIFE